MSRAAFWWLFVAALTLAQANLGIGQQQPPRFRGRVAIVPIDVRVLDRDGNPVPDLTRADFIVSEDGVTQVISVFERVDSLSERVDSLSLEESQRINTTPNATIPSGPRTFVIVLGRGRLQGPARGFDAILNFVEKQTLPRDRFVVAAYNRITDVTQDRHAIRSLIERYRSEHERIEAVLSHWFSGLVVAYGSIDPPPSTQARIEQLFVSAGLPNTRQLELVLSPSDGLGPAERERLLDSLRLGEGKTSVGTVFDPAARQDLERLHATIEHIRFVEGEKHLIFVSSEGLKGLVPSNTEQLTRMASDARVTLSVIHTGGLETSWERSGNTMEFKGPSWRQVWANADSRRLAHDTGGIASIYEYADKTFGRIERSTRLHYVLGYSPQNSAQPGGFRRIAVTVRRPGVTVLYRQGYYAREDDWTVDSREYRATLRVSSASYARATIQDIPLLVSAMVPVSSKDVGEVRAEVRIPPSAIHFAVEGDRHVATLDVAVFVGNRNGRSIGELRKRVELRLTAENFGHIQRDGVVVTGTVKVSDRAKFVKAVVYDHGADRVGSAVIELR